MAGRFPEAAAHFARAVERKQNDPSLLYKWSRATFDAGAYAQAKLILERAQRLAPGHEAILGLFAEIHERAADWDSLAQTAESWLRVRPHAIAAVDVRSAGAVGNRSSGAGDAELPDIPGPRRQDRDEPRHLRTSLPCCPRLRQGRRALDEAERLDAACAHMLSAKATLAMFRGDFEDALAYARRAIDVDPRDAAAFKVLVQVAGGRPDRRRAGPAEAPGGG